MTEINKKQMQLSNVSTFRAKQLDGALTGSLTAAYVVSERPANANQHSLFVTYPVPQSTTQAGSRPAMFANL